MLEAYLNDDCVEVAHTCQLAVDRIRWVQTHGSEEKQEEKSPESAYETVDPTPPYEDKKSVAELQDILCDEEASLFNRYRAMFTLRNMATDDSVRVRHIVDM